MSVLCGSHSKRYIVSVERAKDKFFIAKSSLVVWALHNHPRLWFYEEPMLVCVCCNIKQCQMTTGSLSKRYIAEKFKNLLLIPIVP